jgi:hypothetical protein
MSELPARVARLVGFRSLWSVLGGLLAGFAAWALLVRWIAWWPAWIAGIVVSRLVAAVIETRVRHKPLKG